MLTKWFQKWYGYKARISGNFPVLGHSRSNAPWPGVIVVHRKCEEYFYDQSKLHTAPAPDAKFQIPFQPVKSFSEY